MTTIMDTYQDIKEYLVNNNLVNADEIYNFEKDDLKEQFDSFFNFCITNLHTKCDKYKIQPSSIYFENNLSINAKAWLWKDDFIISVHMGIIANLYPFFTEPMLDFSKHPFRKFEIFEKTCDVSPEYLMFQFATQFTYYHEQAHLIQKSEILKLGVIENYSNDEDAYSQEHHLLEIDADIWGAHHVCYHLIQYFKKQPKDFKTNENLNGLTVLGLSSIFSYFSFLATGKFKIYFKEYKHPHLSIRISYLTDVFLSIIYDTFQGEYVLNKKELLKGTFEFTSELFREKNTGINNLEELLQELYINMDLVKEYFEEMKNEISNRNNLLLNDIENLINNKTTANKSIAASGADTAQHQQ